MNLNISGVNNISNTAENNTDKTVLNGQPKITLPLVNYSTDSGKSLLMQLKAGDVFTGKILDITGSRITIELSGNLSVNAALADALSYNIGDTADFMVKEKFPEQIVLKSLNPDSANNLNNDKTVYNALQKAGLAVNDTTLSLVHNLMKQGQPIDASTLNRYVHMLNNTANALPEDIVFLTKMDIPVTDANVDALHNYYTFSDGISAQAENLSENLQNGLLAAETPKEAGEILSTVLESYSDTLTPKESLQSLPKENLSALQDMLKGFTDSKTESPDSELTGLIAKLSQDTGKNISARTFLNELSFVLQKDFPNNESVHKLMGSKEFNKVINNFLRQEFFLKPENINASNVKKLFAKILSDNNNLTEKLANNPKMNQFVQNSRDISGNINFMNNINHFMSFVQIPLKMTGQNAHGNLYVYRNHKNAGNSSKEELKAFLHLDMDNLGPLDVFVTLKNDSHVTTDFRVSDENILNYIESHLEELDAALNRLGYNAQSAVSLSDKPYSFKTSVLEQEMPPAEIKRYSFDIRA